MYYLEEINKTNVTSGTINDLKQMFPSTFNEIKDCLGFISDIFRINLEIDFYIRKHDNRDIILSKPLIFVNMYPSTVNLKILLDLYDSTCKLLLDDDEYELFINGLPFAIAPAPVVEPKTTHTSTIEKVFVVVDEVVFAYCSKNSTLYEVSPNVTENKLIDGFNVGDNQVFIPNYGVYAYIKS
jgi:hypothetical protein